MGGDPLEFDNLQEVDKLIIAFRQKFGNSKTIWMWTGYIYENLTEEQKEIANKVDVLVDGPFILDKKKLLPYCGSTNQRVIDIKETIKQNKICLKF